MTIQWLGRACFKITHEGYSIIIDPYSAGSTGYPPLRETADMVLVSHDHPGHNNKAAVTLSGAGKLCPFTIEKVEVTHDEANGLLRGMNIIHIIEADGIKLVHTGDIGFRCDDGRLYSPDVLMTHCGSFRTLPSYVMKEMCDALSPNVIIPMHYHHEGYGNRRMSNLADFTDQFYQECDVAEYPTDTVEIVKNMPHQIAVLKYMGK